MPTEQNCEVEGATESAPRADLAYGQLGEKLCLYRIFGVEVVAYTQGKRIHFNLHNWGCGLLDFKDTDVLVQFLTAAKEYIK